MNSPILKTFSSIVLFRRAFYKYKRGIAALIGLGFLSGILGGVGIGAIIPLFSFVSGQIAVNDPVSKILKWAFGVIGVEFSLSLVVTILVLLFVFKAVFLYFANLISAKVALDYERRTREELFKHTMVANWHYLKDHKIGYLSQMVVDDINVSASLLSNISMVILSATSVIAYIAVAVGISLSVTIAAIIIGLGMFFIFKPFFFKIRKLSKQAVRISKEAAHYINQHLLGAKTVKSMAVEDKVLEGGMAYFKELARAKFNLARYNNFMGNFLEPLTLAVIIPIFLFSYKSSSFNIASFAAILYLVQKIFSFVQTIQIRISLINQGIPNLTAVLNYQTEAKRHKEQVGGGDDFKFDFSLKFEGVVFNYDEAEEKILDGLNLTVNKGEMLGLIGHSGSGKTTIADLLMRLFEPKSGKITVDGKELSATNVARWRKNVGYVSQEMLLLNDTIANNIRFCGDGISDENIIEAAKLANIYDFITQRPENFNAMVGERGLKLSAGQRQRIVLARVLARKPKILILDEATSALDNESEVAIQNALEKLRGKITVIIIAHRLSTLSNADRLVVLENGKIAEEGSPKSLLENTNSRFYQIYQAGTGKQ